ncbi:hypothetical protein LTSEMIS_5863 [Salmonella enterica subsp. enterica serovar Mississippi str. A4-633]|nr:hypothetical protein LTSEMIS_5863 [Salmonella enterica subsp. enterica serovar Mississippi str. A4-633]
MSQNQPSAPVWGLRGDITPSFGARLVQEGVTCIFCPTAPAFSVISLRNNCKHWTPPFRSS